MRRLLACAGPAPLLLPLAVACLQPDERRMQCFEGVCETIEEEFYDPSFGGKDWGELVRRYRPSVEGAESEPEFYTLVNEMLFELGVSHLGLIPDEHPEWIGAPAVFSDGGVGIDARILDGEAVVVGVQPDGPGDAAGIRPGALLHSVGGLTLEDIRVDALKPPRSPLDPELLATQSLQQRLFGATGSEIEVAFSNLDGEMIRVTLRRVPRPGRSVILEGLPPSYLELAARRPAEGIGYLRFNAFDPALLEEILAAVERFADTDGIVIDLRGNPGGAFPVRRALAERLITEPGTIWTQRGRRGDFEVELMPPAEPYRGEVVVLTDVLSSSSSEELAGGLQALGRAVVVGEPTTGVVLVAEVRRFDIGATLVYPVAETVLADGSTLEGRGVTPDIHVSLDRRTLAAGRDEVLETAVRTIRERREQ